MILDLQAAPFVYTWGHKVSPFSGEAAAGL